MIEQKAKVIHLYPVGSDRRPVIGYIWARTIPCANPSCKAEIPLLRSLIICDLRNGSKRVALEIKKDDKKKEIQFGIKQGKEISDEEGTMIKGGHCKCPFCNQITFVDNIRVAAQEEKWVKGWLQLLLSHHLVKATGP